MPPDTGLAANTPSVVRGKDTERPIAQGSIQAAGLDRILCCWDAAQLTHRIPDLVSDICLVFLPAALRWDGRHPQSGL